MGILPDKCLSHTDKMPISSHDGFGRASSRSRVRFDSSFIHFLAYQFGSGSVPSLDEYRLSHKQQIFRAICDCKSFPMVII